MPPGNVQHISTPLHILSEKSCLISICKHRLWKRGKQNPSCHLTASPPVQTTEPPAMLWHHKPELYRTPPGDKAPRHYSIRVCLQTSRWPLPPRWFCVLIKVAAGFIFFRLCTRWMSSFLPASTLGHTHRKKRHAQKWYQCANCRGSVSVSVFVHLPMTHTHTHTNTQANTLADPLGVAWSG